jgi:hypothetical protein
MDIGIKVGLNVKDFSKNLLSVCHITHARCIDDVVGELVGISVLIHCSETQLGRFALRAV